jgi:hypothetical protein
MFDCEKKLRIEKYMKKSMRREKESRFNILFDIRKEKQ